MNKRYLTQPLTVYTSATLDFDGNLIITDPEPIYGRYIRDSKLFLTSTGTYQAADFTIMTAADLTELTGSEDYLPYFAWGHQTEDWTDLPVELQIVQPSRRELRLNMYNRNRLWILYA